MAIKSFRHKELQRLFTTGTSTRLRVSHLRRLMVVLGRLFVAQHPRDIAAPALQLHELKGDRAGVWSVRISANWRVTFRFEGVDVIDVDYEDYH